MTHFLIFIREHGHCICVNDKNITDFMIDDGLWCCKTTSDDCILATNYTASYYYVTCIGKTLSLSDQCQDDSNQQTCNYYPSDRFRNGYCRGSHDKYKNRSHLDICKNEKYEYQDH